MLVQGNVQRPHARETRLMVPASAAYEGSNYPFDLRYAGQWEFVETIEGLSCEPIPGAHRDWSVDPLREGGEWLPVVDDFRYNAGANGARDVRDAATGRVTLDVNAHADGMRRKPGVVVIEDGGDRRMGPYQTFRAWFDYEAGGRFYCYRGVSLRPMGVGRAIPELDQGWLLGLRRHVVEAGIVPVMDVSVLDLHVRMLQNRLHQVRRNAEAKANADFYLLRKQETEALIVRMRAAWRAQFGETDTAGSPLVLGSTEADGPADDGSLPAPPQPTTPRRRGA